MRRISFAVVLLFSTLLNAQASNPKALYGRAMNALSGAGPSHDFNAAIDLLKQSAQGGYVPAQTAFGYVLETGFHVPIAHSEAADWYRKAAEQSDDTAAWLLGRMYYLGEIPGGAQQGEKWLRAAADAGSPFGAYFLGLSIDDRDPKAAIAWFKSAAEKGLPYAQLRYAQSLTNGRAAPVDKNKAYVWFMIAYDGGVQEAQTSLQQLEGELGSIETDRAKTDAREMEPKVLRSNNARGCTGWPGELDKVPSPPPLLDAVCRVS
jgi:TPR repeat protein